MNQCRIRLVDAGGTWLNEHIEAKSSQDAADKIRVEYKGCYIALIAKVVNDWK